MEGLQKPFEKRLSFMLGQEKSRLVELQMWQQVFCTSPLPQGKKHKRSDSLYLSVCFPSHHHRKPQRGGQGDTHTHCSGRLRVSCSLVQVFIQRLVGVFIALNTPHEVLSGFVAVPVDIVRTAQLHLLPEPDTEQGHIRTGVQTEPKSKDTARQGSGRWGQARLGLGA